MANTVSNGRTATAPPIAVSGLGKRFGVVRARDGLDLTVERGEVHGFLGPNGAGKTTTMRVMVGLTPATAGTVTIGGMHYRDIPNPGRHVGVLLDASAQHAGRTGREVLTIGAQTMGLPKARVEEMIALVGLSDDEAGRRVRNYSLGMRQRLGIAHALLGDPSVLVLDEPANGLDPEGVHWLRGFLRHLADQGRTVLVSSHVLAEVAQTVDQVVIIARGRLVTQSTLAALTARTDRSISGAERRRASCGSGSRSLAG
jgi:ABC-2 type transport system ATP-binding protein